MSTVIERILTPVAEGITLDFAKRLVKLTSDPLVEARLEELAEKSSAGLLTREEHTEYESLVIAGDLVSILQARARAVLKEFDDRQ